MEEQMKKDKIYLPVIVLLVIVIITGFIIFQSQIMNFHHQLTSAQEQIKVIQKHVKNPILSEIIVPEDGLLFKTENGKIIAKIREGEDGGIFGLFNKQEDLIARISTSYYGGSFELFNKQVNLIARIEVDSNGGNFDLFNNQEEWMIMMEADKYNGDIRLFNNKGKMILLKP